MRLVCPYCGERDLEEFSILGAVAGVRPDPAAPDAAAAFNAYVHLRDTPAGPALEHWYHAAGCRAWLVVRRDTRTHEILATALASP